MEIIIGLLVLGVLGVVGYGFKALGDDGKRQQVLEDSKGKRISDLEAEVGKKDMELKKALAEVNRIEEQYFKTKEEADTLKKDNLEFSNQVRAMDKASAEAGGLKNELKQKDTMLQQETIARQKMQGEISLRDLEVQKKDEEIKRLEADLEKIAQELRMKTQMFDGLKGQYTELENEIQKIRTEPHKVEAPKVEPPKAEQLPRVEPPKVELPKVETPKPEPAKVEVPKVEAPKEEVLKVEPPKPQVPKVEAPKPEPPKTEPPKVEAPKPEPPKTEPPKVSVPPQSKSTTPVVSSEMAGMGKSEPFKPAAAPPSDTDFLKVAPSAPGPVADVPEGAFKFTNINKPPTDVSDAAKDKAKSKTKRETLIPGFQPKPKSEENPE